MSKTNNFNQARKEFLAGLTADQLVAAARRGARVYAGAHEDANHMHLWISLGSPSDRAMHQSAESFGGFSVYRGYEPWENMKAADFKKLDVETIRTDIDESIEGLDIDLDERIERTE
jgi:uncharacterized protein YaeQ